MERDHVGFDCEKLRARLVEWCFEHHALSIPALAPGALAIDRFLEAHFDEHSVPVLVERADGTSEPARRCLHARCRIAGVAFALFELQWYFANAAQADEAERLLIAAEHLPQADPRRAELEYDADALVKGLFSRAFLGENDRGRPSLGLARAIVQHLRRGGFKYSEIAKFMDVTTPAAEMRFQTADMRSVVPYDDTPIELPRSA